LMTGTRQEFKEAKIKIEKLWKSETDIFKVCAPIALEYLAKFDTIKKPENQAAFASGLALFYLTLSDRHFDELKNFALKVLQNPNGQVREAIRKTSDWLYVSLSDRVDPFVYPEGKELTEEQKREQVVARKQYTDLVKEIELLIDKYDNENEHTKYINEMKPSTNKSLQLLWSRLTDNRVYQKIQEQNRPIPMNIFLKRKEIESRLENLLKETKSDFDLDDIKELIYNEEDKSDLNKLILMFSTEHDITELEKTLALISDAWNYFPHKILGGLSPAEKTLEYQQR